MSETKITDLVPQETIDKIKELNTEIQTLLTTYTNTAKELAKGVDVNVKVVGDIDKLEKLLVEKNKEATLATERLNAAIAEQRQVVANTTNTISRQLMEQERVNKTQRAAYTEHEKVKNIIDHMHGSYQRQLEELVKIDSQIKSNVAAQKENEKAMRKEGADIDALMKKQEQLVAEHRALRQEKARLNQIMTAEEKANTQVEGSYVQLSQRLELMKKAYKEMSIEARDTEDCKELEALIQNLDAHLKDLAADMGEFQRNVGNYAIAGQNGVVATDSLIAAMNQEARTTQDLIDQTKILEDAKRMLNTSDENYEQTLAQLNEKIEENKRSLSDVSDIIDKDATSIAEAEAQNKRLQEALKHVDLSSDDAQATIERLNKKIADNTQLIRENTPAIQEQTNATEERTKANKDAADELLGLVGINTNFGESLQGLSKTNAGGVIDGLGTKAKALGNTLMGLLSNPWVLAFLGIVGVAAGFKWWYDYNKGLVEATKLTKDFTGLSGSELKAVRNEVQAVAESYDKDFKEVLEAANAMSKQFGISVQESLKLMEDGFAAGADVNGEFLENVKEYPAYFKEAGISASEFVAITTQANQAGIYSDKGIDVIKEGNLRIREMTKATAEALDAIGISSKEAQKALADGSKTTFDIMQEVSEKLAEFPESSSEVGTALADIFGGPGEDAGLQYILTLKDIDTNLDNVKDRAGELGRLQDEQLKSQIELENAIASVFDATGGSFESMTTSAKIFINNGIVKIIEGCVDIVNWFVRLYNKSIAVRAIFNSIVNSFKTIWATVKFVLTQIIDGFKALGDIIEGVFTLDLGKIKAGYQKGLNAFKDNFVSMVKEIRKNTEDAVRETIDGQMEEVTLDVKANVQTSSTPASKPKGNPNYTPKESAEDKKAREKVAKDAEKAAKEQLKILHDLEDAKIQAMEDGHEKDLALIRLNFKKKIDAITGNSAQEQQLRVALVEQMMKALADCELKYQTELAKINLQNRLASVEKGSKEELDLKLAQLESSRAAELKAAEKTGADVNLINAKFNKERLELEEEYANNLANKITERYGVEEITRNQEYSNAVNALKERYAKEMALAAGNAAKQEEIKRNLENDLYALEVEYSQKAGEAAIKMIEDILNLESLSAEDRIKWEQELAKAKIDLANQIADANAESIDRQIADDERLKEKRKANLQTWFQVASDAIGNISDLVNTLFDGQIEKIEEEQEANTEAGEAELERITDLVEKKVITQEEGEARKRAAEAQTAKKNEELEKKKAALQHKQAVFKKATDLAQAGISTALAITNALTTSPFPLGLAMAAIAGAMGAVQIATILATPIPKYAKGTDNHRGGPAIVGDGGRSEVVLFNGGAWLTPDKPTLVNMPAGAVVIPDVNDFDDNPGGMIMLPYPVNERASSKGYDDSGVRRGVSELAYLIKTQTKQQHADSYLTNFELFKLKV